MAQYPEPWSVFVEHRIKGNVDEMGQPIISYNPPVEYAAYGWAPPSPDTQIRDLGTGVDRDLDVYVSQRITQPLDRVTVPGEGVFTAVGHPEDFNRGPFGFVPGFRVSLKRVEG